MSRPRLGKSEKQRRTAEGVERAAFWSSLSTEEKIASLRARRGESRRQLKKLETQ